MTLSISQMVTMSRLLDEALPLDEGARRIWLENLDPQFHDLATAMREALLPADAGKADWVRLDSLPKIGVGNEAAGSPSDSRTGKRVGPYELLRPLGRGGMAEVWLARRADGAFKREVALKLPLITVLRKDLEQRFAREREILASLNHPNIAQLFDAGFAQDGQPYVALEYVVGTPINAYCDARSLPLRLRLLLFRQVLGAVQYAHAHLVIHRDLKPHNILVSDEGQVKLLDFGIAKLLSEGEAKETELTRLSGRALTLEYAAPEQIAGAAITTATDVYALGVVLYELLTAERPYRLKRDSRGALEEAILEAEPLSPSRVALSEATALARAAPKKKLNREMAGDLDTIVLKTLKKTPAERYATADAFSEDVARFLNGDTVRAQRDTLSYRAIKFARRRWAGIAVASILALTLAGGLIATSYEAALASRQRDAAQQSQLRSLTQTAAARLRDSDVPGALGIVLEVLPHRGAPHAYTPAALGVFHEARAADAQILAMSGHTNTVWSGAFSADGRRVATASWDASARIWDAMTGRQLLTLSGHTGQLNGVAFSPDGKRVVTAAFDKTARVWDATTGVQLMVLAGHERQVMSAVYSPDGRRILTVSTDKTGRLWDATTGRQLMMFAGDQGRLVSAAYSPDGKRIVTAADDKMARIWDAVTGRELMLLSGHSERVWSAAFSPDGARVVTGSEDKTARIWDSSTGRELLRLNGHASRVNSAAFSPDGQSVVTASDDKTIRIWNSSNAQQRTLLSGHTAAVWCAAFSPDGRYLLTTSTDKTARIWAARDTEIVRLSGHSSRLLSAVFSADGNRAVTASHDYTARIWDASSGQQLTLLRGHTDPVNSAVFSPDDTRVLTGSDDKSARVWDATSGAELVAFRGNEDRVSSAAFSPDGKRVVTAAFDKTVRIWDAATGRQLALLGGHTDRVVAAAFSPDGLEVVSASMDKTARIWDSRTGRQIMLLRGHTEMLDDAEFSPDGKRIVTASFDTTARIWEAATGRQLLVLTGHAAELNSARFSPDGLRVVTASSDKTVRIWDSSTGREELLVTGSTGEMASAAFSRDGKRILTASEDGTARIWNALADPLEAQIAWSEAAQFDPLASTDRFKLGLALPSDVRRWPADASACDQAAAAPYDPDRRAAGLALEQIVAEVALAACADTADGSDPPARRLYQHARALIAKQDFAAGKRELERAAALGYRSAKFELASLMARSSAGMLDVPRAIALYDEAWSLGVADAAFELGHLYENGVERADLTSPNVERAWFWYRKAAEAGFPNALARFAEREDAAAAVARASDRDTALLRAFRYYAAAAQAARAEDWPDESWRGWRYRRATLARLLSRDGMQEPVANAYDEVRSVSFSKAGSR